ncbi:class I SAM-dependent methyltransferase [Streptomyces sp. NPDC060235]|uniref:class I SAM-dependent methyltransferase n=1 Tax=Streptomyces sp. NPDC060235 TaxID=3347080 RepID=UPI0036590A70
MKNLSRAKFASSFSSVAALYAAVRPGYPNELFNLLEEAAPCPLQHATVLDIGAGTGIATGLMLERGAHVVAVEPGDGMAAQLRMTHPEVPLVRADGNALPLRNDTADFVTYAQSWHWVDPLQSVQEAERVLRVGGTLGVWWNLPDTTVPWLAEQQTRLRKRIAHYQAFDVTGTAAYAIASASSSFEVITRTLRWTRQISLDLHLANLSSLSYFSVLAPDERRSILLSERTEISKWFPDLTVNEAYRTEMTIAVKRR